MPCHLSKIQGFRWQGGSLERGCLAHSEISWLFHLLHRGHPLIAILTHPLNVSITSMLKPKNTRKNCFFHSFSTSTSRFMTKVRLTRAGDLWPERFIFMIHNLQNLIHMQCRRIERIQSQLPRPQTSPALPGYNPAEH